MMRLLAAIVVGVCAVGCLTSGSTDITAATTMAAVAGVKQGTLIIKVMAGTATLPGATVTVAGLTAITDSRGIASFRVNLRQTYTISVSAEWYQPWTTLVWFQKNNQIITASLQSAIVIPVAVMIVSALPIDK